MTTSSDKTFLRNAIAVFLGYLIIGEFSELLATQAADIAAFWPPAGVGLAAVILLGIRVLPVIALAAFAGNLVDVSAAGSVSFLALGPPQFLSVLIDTALAPVSAVASWLPLVWFKALPNPFGRVRHASVFLLGSAAMGPMFVALLGCVLLVLSGDITWGTLGRTWLTWATGDAVGIVIVTPLIIAFSAFSFVDHELSAARWWAELFGVLAFIGLLVLPVSLDLPLDYLAIFPLIVAAFRLGLRGASIAVSAVAVSALALDVQEMGYFTRFEPGVSILLVQTFIGTLGVVPLLLVPMLVEQRETGARQAKIQQDLEIARSIQQGLLPQVSPACAGFDIAGWNRPADETGGDYFDWFTVREGRTLITLADVSGHGIGPALVASASRAYARALSASSNGLQNLLTQLNELLVCDIVSGRFVTLAAVVVDENSEEVKLLSAGHGSICLYRAQDQRVEIRDADDIPIGIVPGHDYPEAVRLSLEPGDMIVLATDGFIEWRNGENKHFGIDRFTESIRACAMEPASHVVKHLAAAVQAHAADTEQADDLTVVVIKRARNLTGSR